MKLVDTEKEADKARKDSKLARDHFNDVKMRRFVLIFFLKIEPRINCKYLKMRTV